MNITNWNLFERYLTLMDFSNKQIEEMKILNFSEKNTEWFNKFINDNMKKEKEIIGYICPMDLCCNSQYKVLKGSIFNIEGTFKFSDKKERTMSLPKEIVETWEAVYEEEKLTFGGEEVTFKKVTKEDWFSNYTIEITCKGETGTNWELDKIIDFITLDNFKFGNVEWQNPTKVIFKERGLSEFGNNIKIGCLFGSTNELLKIQEKAKELLCK